MECRRPVGIHKNSFVAVRQPPSQNGVRDSKTPREPALTCTVSAFTFDGMATSSSPIPSPDGPASFRLSESGPDYGRLAQPLTDSERAASRKRLDQMHPGNRFRLMAGLPLLPESPPETTSH
ncbi:hypothetical protein EI77_03729 [Prosthecobacter fusiformis]|uniref:Uncharacterized protein n=1 Tax=Prosthecobacter fusiformis TaxID=48464 RepID=A0A4R7RML1_9BACT|nr:hypothetical protein EI77_03729 [Prosthecobacter fusiformis]